MQLSLLVCVQENKNLAMLLESVRYALQITHFISFLLLLHHDLIARVGPEHISCGSPASIPHTRNGHESSIVPQVCSANSGSNTASSLAASIDAGLVVEAESSSARNHRSPKLLLSTGATTSKILGYHISDHISIICRSNNNRIQCFIWRA